MLLYADEVQCSAFQDWSKFQILVQQGKTPEGIKWCFFALQLGSEVFSETASEV